MLTNFVALGIIRGAGETRLAMFVNLSVVLLNALLAPILIFGLLGFPRLEVRGAALAMGIAHSLGFFRHTLFTAQSEICSLSFI